MLNITFGDAALRKTNRFQDDSEDVEDVERPRRLSTSSIDNNVEEKLFGHRRITIADDVSTAQKLL